MQLPPELTAKGTAKDILEWPSPKLVATASGASIWAASNMSRISLSRILAQETSRISSSFSPSAAAKPHSSAAITTDASIRGINPMRSFFMASSFQKVRSGDDRLRHLAQAFLGVHLGLADQAIGVLFAEALARHQDSLGALDQLAVGQRQLGLAQFLLQPREQAEAQHAHVENVLDPVLFEPVHDIGGDARGHGILDGGAIALIHEHGDGPLDQPADLEHLLQHVAIGAPQIDENDFWID